MIIYGLQFEMVFFRFRTVRFIFHASTAIPILFEFGIAGTAFNGTLTHTIK